MGGAESPSVAESRSLPAGLFLISRTLPDRGETKGLSETRGSSHGMRYDPLLVVLYRTNWRGKGEVPSGKSSVLLSG
jgi:hypothetical protein